MTWKKGAVMVGGALAVFLAWHFLRPKKANAATMQAQAEEFFGLGGETGGYKRPGSEDKPITGDLDFGDIKMGGEPVPGSGQLITGYQG